MAVPPLVRLTAIEYEATAPATAVNVNVVELIVEAVGVVSVAVDVSVKSDQNALEDGNIEMVQTILVAT